MSLSALNLNPARDGAGQFRSTHWSVVLTAGQGNSTDSAKALETLCRAYWYPIYAYARRRGQSPEMAQDLTQEFFSRLLTTDLLARADRDKGKFRSFLLGAMNHLIATEWQRTQTQKRGGGMTHFSLDAVSAEDRYRVEPMTDLAPDKLFDRRWAEALLDRVVDRVRSEYDARAAGVRFDDIKVFLLDHKGTESFQDAAARLGLSVTALKSAVQRLRRRYRTVFQDEIAQTVSSPADQEQEIRHLLSALNE